MGKTREKIRYITDKDGGIEKENESLNNEKSIVNYDDGSKIGISDTLEILFRSDLEPKMVASDKISVLKNMVQLPKKVQDEMKDVTFDLGNKGSFCDYKNGIVYLSSNATKEQFDHEIGHLIEYRMMDQKVVEEYKNYLVEGLSLADMSIESYKNSAGEKQDILIVKGERFVSEYQGRIYVDKIEDAFNADGTIKTEYLLEAISEPFRMYCNENDSLKENEKAYDLIKEAVENGQP